MFRISPPLGGGGYIRDHLSFAANLGGYTMGVYTRVSYFTEYCTFLTEFLRDSLLCLLCRQSSCPGMGVSQIFSPMAE